MEFFRPDRAAVHVSLAGLYALFFFSTFSTAGYNVALALILLATLLSAKPFLQELHKKPLFILISLLTLYVFLRSLAALNQTPDIAAESDPHWSHHLRTTCVISMVAGWWLYHHAKHLNLLISLAIAGLFVGVLYEGDLNALASLDFSKRTVWGYQPNYLGMIAGIACLILIGHGLFRPPKNGHTSMMALTIIACIPSLLMLVTSQSRAAWLGLAAALPVLVFLHIRNSYYDTNHPSWPRILKFSAPLILVLFFSFYFHGDFLFERLIHQQESIKHLLSGDLDQAAGSGGSTGKRVAAWFVGIETILSHPIFGAGPSMSSQLLSQYNLAHFHNIYLEIFVSFGFIGAFLYINITALLIYYLYKAYNNNLVSAHFFATMITVTLFVAIILFFSIRIGQPGGRATLNALGAVYVFAFLRYHNARKSVSETNR